MHSLARLPESLSTALTQQYDALYLTHCELDERLALVSFETALPGVFV